MQVPSRFLYWTFSTFLQKRDLRAKPCGNVCNLGSWEAEAGGLQIQGQPKPHSEFEASLGYTVRPCLKTKTQTQKQPLPSLPEHFWLACSFIIHSSGGIVDRHCGKDKLCSMDPEISQLRAEFDRQWSLGGS